jgi:hypothetical protein
LFQLFIRNFWLNVLCSWGYSAVLELFPDLKSDGGWCLFCCARTFRTASRMPSIAISGNLAPFDELRYKVITHLCLLESAVADHLWASEGIICTMQNEYMVIWLEIRGVEDYRPSKATASLGLG